MTGSVTIVTQTSVRPEDAKDFAAWQHEISTCVSEVPGFVEQRVFPPSPPVQPDWVITQRFKNMEAAQGWLQSSERASRVEQASSMLVGRDDVNILRDDAAGVLPAPASVVFSTRVKPGCEAGYQAWERKMAAAQSQAPGFAGYRFEPPVEQVQESFVAILKFDTEANLQSWMDSPKRKELLPEADQFTEELRTFVARTGFDHWFEVGEGAGGKPPPAWKMNLMVLLMLYPIVFLWGFFVGTPFLANELDVPFAINLFIGNVVSVTLLTWAVPWIARRFSWWLQPKKDKSVVRINLIGAAIVGAFYLVMIIVFWQFF